MVYATDRSKAAVLVLFLFYTSGFVVFTTRRLMLSLTLLLGLIFIQFCLALWSSHVRKRELVYMLLVKLYVYLACVIFCLFLFLLVSEVGCGLWLWHSLDFSFNVFISARHINMKTKQNNNNNNNKKKKKKKQKKKKKKKQTNKKTYDWVSRATDRFHNFCLSRHTF